MKLRIVKFPWSPKRASGISLVTKNPLGYDETFTYVLQIHKWVVSETGFVEVWEDVKILDEKVAYYDGRSTGAAG